MNIKTPDRWRKGQTIFNFLEWLGQNGHAPANQNRRMADPFHIQDEEWDKLYKEYLDEQT